MTVLSMFIFEFSIYKKGGAWYNKNNNSKQNLAIIHVEKHSQ